MRSFKYHLPKLGQLVSSAGMRYLDARNVLAGRRRNEIVLKALKQAGVMMDKQSIDAELAGVVRAAREVLATLGGKQPEHLADFLESVQKTLPGWATSLSGSTFLELFWRLVEARENWQKNRAPPFEAWQQSLVAAEVDAFVAAVPGGFGWVEVEVSIYEIAGGLESDEDEDEEQAAQAATRGMEMPGLGGVVGEMVKDEGARRAMEGEIPDGVEMMDLS